MGKDGLGAQEGYTSCSCGTYHDHRTEPSYKNKKDRCSYAIKYKAKKEPKCGCKLCERKWEIKKALEVLGINVDLGDMDLNNVEHLRNIIEDAVEGRYYACVLKDKPKPRTDDDDYYKYWSHG